MSIDKQCFCKNLWLKTSECYSIQTQEWYDIMIWLYCDIKPWTPSIVIYYEGESISNQPNLFPVEIHLFFFDVIAL